MTIGKQWWVIALGSMVMACELDAEQLEVGDADDEVDESGDGDAASLECVIEGTNLDGGSEPDGFPIPECEVECATGWGHDVAPLPIEWTVDLEHEGPNTGFTYVDTMPDGGAVALIGYFEAPARLVRISPEGELVGDVTQPAIDGDVWDLGVDDDGMIYALWRKGEMQAVTALTSAGEHAWTTELGGYLGFYSEFVALDSGVVVALNPPTDFELAELVRVSADGEALAFGAIPYTLKIDVAPSGDTLVLANTTEVRWMQFDFDFGPNVTQVQGIADVSLITGLVALDDERAVGVGVSRDKDFPDEHILHGVVKQVGQLGLEWEGHYDRAVSWCPELHPGELSVTEEAFWDVARLPDGSLIVTGVETTGNPAQFEAGEVQPWVGHVSAQGEVLAVDRGFWRGQAAQVAAASDGSAYVLMTEVDEQAQMHLHLRKYAP